MPVAPTAPSGGSAVADRPSMAIMALDAASSASAFISNPKVAVSA